MTSMHIQMRPTPGCLKKLLRYLNVATANHKWCALEHWRINAIQTKCSKNNKNRTSSGTSGLCA